MGKGPSSTTRLVARAVTGGVFFHAGFSQKNLVTHFRFVKRKFSHAWPVGSSDRLWTPGLVLSYLKRFTVDIQIVSSGQDTGFSHHDFWLPGNKVSKIPRRDDPVQNQKRNGKSLIASISWKPAITIILGRMLSLPSLRTFRGSDPVHRSVSARGHEETPWAKGKEQGENGSKITRD